MRAWTFLAVLGLAASAYGFNGLVQLDAAGLEVFDVPGVEGIFPIIGGQPLHNGAVCTSALLQYCQGTFGEAIGATSPADWTNPQTLFYIINKIYKQGLDKGVIPLCSARAQFYQCLGAAYDSCVNRRWLVGHSFNLQNATIYVQIMKEIDFECNAGSIQTTQEWPCLEGVRTSAQYQYNSTVCTSAFNNNIRNNNTQANICYQGQQFANCMSNLFSQCSPDAVWWECERVSKIFEIDQFCPKLNCDYTNANLNGNGFARKTKTDLVLESVAHHMELRERAMNSAAKHN
uniref:Secreted protein n=1 Tax=Steinernema glaseri TaxID=37863 RepID=A0A1I8A0V2_9BILA